MSDLVKTITIIVMLGFLMATWQAYASLPRERGVSFPETVWSGQGITGAVSGKVVTTLDRSKGVEGAYVALVNPMSPSKEYANATTDADGNYRFTNVSATYSSALYRGPDGNGESYQQGMNAYMVYANYSSVEAYSGSFGVDTNRSNNVVDPVVINLGVPSIEPTPEPTPEPEPTAIPATPTPAPTPAPASFPAGLLLGGAAVLVLLAIIAAAAYFLYHKKGRRGK